MEGIAKRDETFTSNFEKKEGLLYMKEQDPSRGTIHKLCVPKVLTNEVIALYHDQDAHPGILKTYMNCRSQCHWANMQRDINVYISKCVECARAKHSNNKRVLEGHLAIPPRAGHTYAIDIVGSLPKVGTSRKILVVVCTYSRYTFAEDISAGTAAEVITKLDKLFHLIGFPEELVSDNAGNFTSELFESYLNSNGIEHQFTTPYNPTGNALAERTIRSVLTLLRVLVKDKPRNWPDFLKHVCLAINTGFNLTLRERPYYLYFNRDPNPKYKALRQVGTEVERDEQIQRNRYAHEMVAEELEKEHQTRDKKLQASGRLTTYKESDIVYLQRRFVSDQAHKIKYPYVGPFRVKEVMGNSVRLLSLTTGKEKRASMRSIKLFKGNTLTRTQNKNIEKVFPVHEEAEREEKALTGVEEEQIQTAPPRYNLRDRTTTRSSVGGK